MKLPLFTFIYFAPLFLIGQTSISFEQIVEASPKTQIDLSKITLYLPNTLLGRQKLLDVDFSEPPDDIVNVKSEYYAQYVNSTLSKHEEIRVTSSLILFRNDLYTAKKREQPLDKQTNLGQFLKREDHLEIDAKPIKEAAAKLRGKDEESSVRNIFNFVIDHLTYKDHRNESRSALVTFKRGSGGCTAYSELMIALCRANEIPARYAIGFLTQNSFNTRHVWVEVYFSKYGWVAFDPTYADIKDDDTSFDKMKNQYIYLSYDRDYEKLNWRSMGLRSLSIRYRYKTTNWLNEEIRKIEKLTYEGNDDDAKLKIDSLINEGVRDYRLYSKRANINLQEDKLEMVLPDLQGALKYCYFDKDKGEVHFQFVNFYAKKREIDLAINHLKRALDIGYVFKYKEYKSLVKGKRYSDLRAHPKFSELEDLLENQHGENWYVATEMLPVVWHNLELLRPNCNSIEKDESYLLKGIDEKMILENNVKEIKIKVDGNTSIFHFSKEGKVIYKRELTRYRNHEYWAKYDNRNRKISSFQINYSRDRDTTYYKYFFQYNNNCLTEIKQCRYDCDPEEAKKLLEIDRKDKRFTEVSLFFNEKEESGERKIYEFDEKDRLLNCLVINDQDSTYIHWDYDDHQFSKLRHVGDEKKQTSIYNAQGQLVEMTDYNSTTKYKYNNKDQLVETFRTYRYGWYEGNSKTKYKYYKNGLLKEVIDKMAYKKSKRTYQYEFFD